MNRRNLVCLILFLIPAFVFAQTTAPLKDDASLGELKALRDAIEDAYNKGDVDKMVQYLHPEVIIIFPDGELLHGRDGLKNYYNKMLKGPDSRVKSYTAAPQVEGRQIRGDVDLSWGLMNDRYVLNDGTDFTLNSRFTVTLIKTADGPQDTGGWMIRSFHSSTSAFDNPVLWMISKKMMVWGGVVGVVAGIILGVVVTLFIRRKRPASL